MHHRVGHFDSVGQPLAMMRPTLCSSAGGGAEREVRLAQVDSGRELAVEQDVDHLSRTETFVHQTADAHRPGREHFVASRGFRLKVLPSVTNNAPRAWFGPVASWPFPCACTPCALPSQATASSYARWMPGVSVACSSARCSSTVPRAGGGRDEPVEVRRSQQQRQTRIRAELAGAERKRRHEAFRNVLRVLQGAGRQEHGVYAAHLGKHGDRLATRSGHRAQRGARGARPRVNARQLDARVPQPTPCRSRAGTGHEQNTRRVATHDRSRPSQWPAPRASRPRQGRPDVPDHDRATCGSRRRRIAAGH